MRGESLPTLSPHPHPPPQGGREKEGRPTMPFYRNVGSIRPAAHRHRMASYHGEGFTTKKLCHRRLAAIASAIICVRRRGAEN